MSEKQKANTIFVQVVETASQEVDPQARHQGGRLLCLLRRGGLRSVGRPNRDQRSAL